MLACAEYEVRGGEIHRQPLEPNDMEHLPIEVIQRIFIALHERRDVNSVLAFAYCSKELYAVLNDSWIWAQFFTSRYDHDAILRRGIRLDYRSEYKKRCLVLREYRRDKVILEAKTVELTPLSLFGAATLAGSDAREDTVAMAGALRRGEDPAVIIKERRLLKAFKTKSTDYALVILDMISQNDGKNLEDLQLNNVAYVAAALCDAALKYRDTFAVLEHLMRVATLLMHTNSSLYTGEALHIRTLRPAVHNARTFPLIVRRDLIGDTRRVLPTEYYRPFMVTMDTIAMFFGKILYKVVSPSTRATTAVNTAAALNGIANLDDYVAQNAPHQEEVMTDDDTEEDEEEDVEEDDGDDIDEQDFLFHVNAFLRNRSDGRYPLPPSPLLKSTTFDLEWVRTQLKSGNLAGSNVFVDATTIFAKYSIWEGYYSYLIGNLLGRRATPEDHIDGVQTLTFELEQDPEDTVHPSIPEHVLGTIPSCMHHLLTTRRYVTFNGSGVGPRGPFTFKGAIENERDGYMHFIKDYAGDNAFEYRGFTTEFGLVGRWIDAAMGAYEGPFILFPKITG